MIDHVQLACPPGSEAASRAFYTGVLGLPEKPKPPLLAARGGCWFAGVRGELADPRMSTGIELHLGVEADFRPARKAHPGLVWPDLDGLADRLAAAGYPVIWADPAEIPGRRRFHTTDPHGNRLEFLAPIS
jgi:catechol 2,3-dioxygenase-like lactoylglutathione lyase family enzyme